MGKAPVEATTRCVHAFTHTHSHWILHSGFFFSIPVSHFKHSFSQSVSLSLNTLLLRIITCLLSQCQSLGEDKETLGRLLLEKTERSVQ